MCGIEIGRVVFNSFPNTSGIKLHSVAKYDIIGKNTIHSLPKEVWTMAYMYAMINKETLAHICTKKKVSNQFIINRTKFKTDKLEKWLDPTDDSLPTVNQAKCIATCLHIPFAALYMNPQDIPVREIPSIKNMRVLYGEQTSDNSALNIAMIDLIIERQYLNELQAELGIEQNITFAPTVPNSDDPVVWADAIRNYLQLDIETQYKCQSTRQFYLYLREQVEKRGVFVHCFTDVPLDDARGLAIYDVHSPIIGINEDDHTPAKSFSIIHELVHLYKRESSMCNVMFNHFSMHQEEIFCNAVAGELLVPQKALEIILKNGHYAEPYDIKDIEKIAKKFSVSRDVIIRRLLDINKIDDVEYHTYADAFRLDIERTKEEQRLARQEGRKSGFAPEMSRVAFDRTSHSVCVALYKGFCENIYSKRDVANHVRIDLKHIDKFLMEVSKWSN
jgi:Zn-dependent peptidase ImmA (M78 family)